MKRSGPLTRKTPLRRGTWIRRPASIPARSPERAADSTVWRYVTLLAFHLAGGRCRVRGPRCSGSAAHGHHRVLQSQGGPDTLANCLPVCPACHRHVHARPAESYRRGWMIRGAVYRRRVSLEVAGG